MANYDPSIYMINWPLLFDIVICWSLVASGRFTAVLQGESSGPIQPCATLRNPAQTYANLRKAPQDPHPPGLFCPVAAMQWLAVIQ